MCIVKTRNLIGCCAVWLLVFSCSMFSAPAAAAERMIPVPESTLKQLLMESNLQAQILDQLEKNNAMQQTELAELKRELRISKDKLIIAETLSGNAEKALVEANAYFEAYSKEMKAKNDSLEHKLRVSKRQSKFYGILAGTLAAGAIGILAKG